MHIEIRGRNVEVTDEIHTQTTRRFKAVARQVSELATLDIELREERNPSIADSQVAEATLRLKGTTIRAREASPDMLTAIKALSLDVRRQVKRHRELRRHRTEARRSAERLRSTTA